MHAYMCCPIVYARITRDSISNVPHDGSGEILDDGCFVFDDSLKTSRSVQFQESQSMAMMEKKIRSFLRVPINGHNGAKRFERFWVASRLSKEDDQQQVSTLLYYLDEEAEGVLDSTGITDEDKKKYDKVHMY